MSEVNCVCGEWLRMEKSTRELEAELDHAILNRNKLAKKVAVLIAEIPERAWSNGLWDRLAEAEKSIVATTPEGE